jgi:hypothetical protein
MRVITCPLTQFDLCAYCAQGFSTRLYIHKGKYRDLVRLCGVMRWPAGLLYAPEVMRRPAGDRASDTLRRRILHRGIGCLLDEALRDLG